MKHRYEVFADYFYFALEDDGANPTLDNVWHKQAIEDLLSVGNGYILVGTVRNMTVPVTVEIADSRPAAEYLDTMQVAADHVTACSLAVRSGKVVVLGNEYYPDAPRILVAPGTYEARVFYFNLDKIGEDGLDGEDAYHVVLFPGQPIEPSVLKRWHPPR